MSAPRQHRRKELPAELAAINAADEGEDENGVIVNRDEDDQRQAYRDARTRPDRDRDGRGAGIAAALPPDRGEQPPGGAQPTRTPTAAVTPGERGPSETRSEPPGGHPTVRPGVPEETAPAETPPGEPAPEPTGGDPDPSPKPTPAPDPGEDDGGEEDGEQREGDCMRHEVPQGDVDQRQCPPGLGRRDGP